MSKTNLDELYSLRKDFTIIGVTGRVGSGCSVIADILSEKFLPLPEMYASCGEKTIQSQKRELVHNYCSKNWKEYKIIEYKKVLLFLLLPDLLGNFDNKLLYDYFRFKLKDPSDQNLIDDLKSRIEEIIKMHSVFIREIKRLKIRSNKQNKSETNLRKIGQAFWSEEFEEIAERINDLLFNAGFIERKMLLHHISNNYRSTGKPFSSENPDSRHIFHIAKVINKIIKATKVINKGKCHVVIDSLKNSLEINFFRERYSAFYMIAVKNDNRNNELSTKYKSADSEKIQRLVEMDESEYSCTDYSKGIFYVPDVQNCIQISDYHVNVRPIETEEFEKENDYHDTFYTVQEQLYKLQALIQQPSLITPEPIERVMQLAFTARLNSGCISRQVGAAVTDINFSIKAIGWNDVPKGAIPCSLRNAKEINSCGFGYTDFEKGIGVKETENISTDISKKEIDKESVEFNQYVSEFYSESNFPESSLNGRNCPNCFKTAYNNFKGDKNQVHTRSLHAEENAMLQISKFGGQALEGGYLFTTASTCELCAKKAYQLGIHTIYYIDPYPGISRSHILKSNPKTDPKMVLFSGAVGRAYLKFYEPFLSQKDEMSLISGVKMKEPHRITQNKIREILYDAIEGDTETQKKLDHIFQEKDVNVNKKLLEIIKNGLKD